MRFLDYSRASVAETVSHSYVALDQDYIGEKELNLVNRQADIVWKKVNKFISYLNKSAQKKTKSDNLNKSD